MLNGSALPYLIGPVLLNSLHLDTCIDGSQVNPENIWLGAFLVPLVGVV